jgi:hypothetical protein
MRSLDFISHNSFFPGFFYFAFSIFLKDCDELREEKFPDFAK